MPPLDVAIIGAGPSGLACARVLASSGATCAVLERSRGVGGRCATRRVEGQPVDHGAAFVHGSDPDFLEAVRAAGGASIVVGWPARVSGEGAPCEPRAFAEREQRLAYAEGMTTFPKALAEGIDVRLEVEATGLESIHGGVRVTVRNGASVEASAVVCALPVPQSRRLIDALPSGDRDVDATHALLELVGSQSCLTWIGGYRPDVPSPAWDVLYPSESTVVQMISHDSAKRVSPEHVVLVAQARPCWSRARLEQSESAWSAELAREVARIVGPWASRPAWSQSHRWRYARADRAGEMARPLLLRLPEGGRVVIAGESFAPGGGIQAAWLAGRAGARRLIQEV